MAEIPSSLSNNQTLNSVDTNQSRIDHQTKSNMNNELLQTQSSLSSNYDVNNATSNLSIHESRPNSNSFYPKSNYSNHYQTHLQATSQAELTAFTQPLMSIEFPYSQAQNQQRNYYPRRPYISNQQTFVPTKTKSETTVTQPEYYVDSFQSNFSKKSSSNNQNNDSNNNNNNIKTKPKHVTFQEPEQINEISDTYPNPFVHYQRSTWTNYTPNYRHSRPYNRYTNPPQYYTHQYDDYYSMHPTMMSNTRSRALNAMSPPWIPNSYYVNPQPIYYPPVHRTRQLYDPNQPKASSPSESQSSSNTVEKIPMKTKKKTKPTADSEESVVTTPPTPLHPITILRKPSTETEVPSPTNEKKDVSSSHSSNENEQKRSNDSVDISPRKEEEEEEEEQQQQPAAVSTEISDQEEQSENIPTFPSHELLSILQSANCISSLNEYSQQRKFSLKYDYSSTSSSSFTCSLSIDNHSFPPSPSCPSKNEAQKLACDQALRILYRKSCLNDQSSLTFSDKHDYIAHRSLSTFHELNVNDLLFGRKTLACMLMITNNQFEQARVISIATGNTCLDETNLSYANDGTALHDCHAEVLARRGLIKFFFEQLKQTKENQSSIFEYNSTIDKYELNENITFHMYISSLPCGNASVNLPTNFLRYKQGQIEGTQLASTSSHQYPIKSCSDKILRWNILGIQGGLLINFLVKPIYLETITIACEATLNRERLQTCLCEYLKDNLSSLPQPYEIHCPDIDCPKTKAFQQERQVGKLQTNAFAWNTTLNNRTELLEPITGKLKTGRLISILSKQNLFRDFQNLSSNQCSTYREAKQLNETYVQVKNLISEAFEKTSHDSTVSWLSKSVQLEQFSID